MVKTKVFVILHTDPTGVSRGRWCSCPPPIINQFLSLCHIKLQMVLPSTKVVHHSPVLSPPSLIPPTTAVIRKCLKVTDICAVDLLVRPVRFSSLTNSTLHLTLLHFVYLKPLMAFMPVQTSPIIFWHSSFPLSLDSSPDVLSHFSRVKEIMSVLYL